MDDELIDICGRYIESKDCHYLAKEGYIVFYQSITGRQSDFMWHKQTVKEASRIIKAMLLNSEQTEKLRDSHIITAFQEHARVYEMGVKSRYKVREGLFNYYEHCDMGMEDSIMGCILDWMAMRGIDAIGRKDLIYICEEAYKSMKVSIKPTEIRNLIFKHFEAHGYVCKTGTERPLVRGQRITTMQKPHTKPSDVIEVYPMLITELCKTVTKELK